MKHSQYKELTKRLLGLVKFHKKMRSAFEETPNDDLEQCMLDDCNNVMRIVLPGISEASKIMSDCADGFLADIQLQGVEKNLDVKRLVEAMSKVVEVVSVPIKGAGWPGAYDDVLDQCRDWIEQYRFRVGAENTEIKPLGCGKKGQVEHRREVEEFKAEMVKLDAFKKAVKDGWIVVEGDKIIWTKSLVFLSVWLMEGVFSRVDIGSKDVVLSKQLQWHIADGVFTINEVQITYTRLRDAYHHRSHNKYD